MLYTDVTIFYRSRGDSAGIVIISSSLCLLSILFVLFLKVPVAAVGIVLLL